MTEASLPVCFRAIRARLNNQSLWGTRLYADLAPAGTALPYVVYFYMGGGEYRGTKSPAANHVIGIKCVAADLTGAIAGQNLINQLMDDSGLLDTGTALSDGSEWTIFTVTEEETIAQAELLGTGALLRHYGAKYRFILGR